MGKKNNIQRPKGGDSLNKELQGAQIVTSNRIVICKAAGCHDIATTVDLCRFHYLASWRKIKTKEAKKKGQELDIYLSELSKKFPEEFLAKLRNEVEEMAEREELAEGEEPDRATLFDQMEDDEDLDHIIHGLKVEDY